VQPKISILHGRYRLGQIRFGSNYMSIYKPSLIFPNKRIEFSWNHPELVGYGSGAKLWLAEPDV
jgi:hypothetical protein